MDHNISYADGGNWVGSLIQAVGTLGAAGIQLGGTVNTNKSALEQARINAQAAIGQAGWNSVGNSAAANQVLYAALANNQNNNKQQPAKDNTTIIVVGLLALGAVVAIFFVLKSE